ncbi:protein lifeguard 2 [Copidosoma floridanum]|uniref:protein lifeguard 2 n=1 Tax=Copidosoma floridanum TaxID=29053 RepID=UPI0006C94BE6|nr:protein lifeguard 2 [Copidosoma floridanum]XP_014218186.1 protein lifeguard 2 [Copidosoma floridanum]
MREFQKTEGSELGEMNNFQFSEKTIRQAFIRKVYAILLLQLLVTCSISALMTFHEDIKLFMHTSPHQIIVIVCAIIAFVLVIVLTCCNSVCRKHPTNLIFLIIFTLAESVVVGFICSLYDPKKVLLAAGITAAICLCLTIFAFQTKFDFTGFGPYLFIFLIALVILGFVVPFFRSEWLVTLVSAGGAVLFSFYIIYDTQLMLGGDHKYSISPEEHIFASLSLYLDIINLFLYILRLLR